MPLSDNAKLYAHIVELRKKRGWGARRIRRELLEKAKDLIAEGAITLEGDIPPERTLTRELPAIDALPEPDLRQYRRALWPDAFGSDGDLPWEAAAAVQELTGLLGRVPLVPLAEWYWRLRLRFPDTGLDRAREGSPLERVEGVRKRQRLCLAWAHAFYYAELVPRWPEVVSQRLNEGYEMRLGDGTSEMRDPVLDDKDMLRLIAGKPIRSSSERMTTVREDTDGAQG